MGVNVGLPGGGGVLGVGVPGTGVIVGVGGTGVMVGEGAGGILLFIVSDCAKPTMLITINPSKRMAFIVFMTFIL